MRQLGSAAGAYASQNDGALPAVDSRGTDTWAAAASRENANAWYNALPVILSQKSVAQYAANPQAFYSKENILFLPGAKYPDSDKKLARPFFAIAINTELQRMDKNGKKSVKLAQISNPARTVLFLEQGLPGEVKVSPIQPKYDGSPRGSAKSFVARYEGVGVVTFVDGHVEIIERKDMVEQAVLDKFAPKPGDVIWAETPAESPNK